jgi:hypothetical protein
MDENSFTKRYRTWDNAELLDIIESSHEYQPLAVEAARLEIYNRQLTDEQIADAKSEHAKKQQTRISKEPKIIDIKNKVKSVGSSLVETFNPVQKERLTTSRSINLLSMFLGGLFIYQLLLNLDLLKFMLTSEDGKWDLSMAICFFPLIILPIAAILLWFRKKIGWTLAVIYFSYIIASTFSFFFKDLASLGVKTGMSIYILTIGIYGGALWQICKKPIRDTFNVERRAMFITIGIIIALTIAVIWSI